jgi:hypothetical protein
MEERIGSYLHCHPTDIPTILSNTAVDHQTIMTEILLLADLFHVMDAALLDRINLIYPLIVDSSILQEETEEQLRILLREFKQKIDSTFCT